MFRLLKLKQQRILQVLKQYNVHNIQCCITLRWSWLTFTYRTFYGNPRCWLLIPEMLIKILNIHCFVIFTCSLFSCWDGNCQRFPLRHGTDEFDFKHMFAWFIISYKTNILYYNGWRIFSTNHLDVLTTTFNLELTSHFNWWTEVSVFHINIILRN